MDIKLIKIRFIPELVACTHILHIFFHLQSDISKPNFLRPVCLFLQKKFADVMECCGHNVA